MPKFLFHIKQVVGTTFDPEGMEFANIGVATAEAELAMVQIAVESIRTSSPFDGISLIICDTDGNPVAEVVADDVLRKFLL